jgi:hypothetical protein
MGTHTPIEWTDAIGVAAPMFRFGKAGAGRLLDGLEHNGLPSRASRRAEPAEKLLVPT